MIEMPKLDFEHIEWRPEGKPFQRGQDYQCLWVAYLQAPTVAAMFDEWVGPGNWSDHYELREFRPKGTDVRQALECTIKVYDEALERWVGKSDIGEFTNWSAIKGGYSDAFKRCATLKWGVGRGVYDLPQIWAPCRTYKRGQDLMIGGETRDTRHVIMRQAKAAGFEIEVKVAADSFDGDDEHGETPHSDPGPSKGKAPAKTKPQPPVASEGAPGGSGGLMEAFNALGGGKQTAMKELKGNGLWPLKDVDAEHEPEAMEIIGRVAAAVEAAS